MSLLSNTRIVKAAVFFALMLCCAFAFGQDNASPGGASLEVSDISTPYDGKVSVSAAVTDNKGNPIGGLKKDAFTIAVDDKKIPEFSFKQTSDDPISVIIAVDVSGSMKGVPIVEAKKIISQFMGYLKESDYVSLVTFGIGVKKVIGFTKDKDIINAKVDELLANENRTVLFKAVTESLKQAALSPTPKSAILLVTDSKDEHSGVDEADVITAVRGAGIPVYTVALGKYKYIDFLKSISEASAGQSFLFPKYEDVAHLAKAAASGLKAMYLMQFSFSAPNGKYTAVVKAAYNGMNISAKKEFTNNVPKDSLLAVVSSPAAFLKSGPNGEEMGTRPVSYALFYLLIGLSVVILVLLVRMSHRQPTLPESGQSSQLMKIHGEVAATADRLAKIDSEIQMSSQKNSDLTTALSTEITAFGGQISSLTHNIDDAASSIKNNITDARIALAEVVQGQYEEEFTAIKTEMSALKDGIDEKNLEFTAYLSTEISAVSGQISALTHNIDDAASSIKNKITDTRMALAEVVQGQYEEGFNGLKTELSAFKDNIIEKNEEFTAAITTAIQAAGVQISALSQQIDNTVTTILNSIAALEHNLRDAAQNKFERQFTSLNVEIKALEEALSVIMAKQIEQSEHQLVIPEKGLATAPPEAIYVSAIEKIQEKLNNIDTSLIKLDIEIKQYAAGQSAGSAAVTKEIKAVEDKISDMPRHIDTGLDAMKYGIVDLVNTIMDIEKSHGLTPGQTLEKVEGRIIGIENSITLLASEILKGPQAAEDELTAIAQKISAMSQQMEDSVYAVKDIVTGMESGIREAAATMYGKEIAAMTKEAAYVRDALAAVMRFLLILSE